MAPKIPDTRSNLDDNSLALAPWVIVCLCIVGLAFCGLVVFAAKRNREKKMKRSAKEVRDATSASDKEFKARIESMDV
jgi:hypothetical protein